MAQQGNYHPDATRASTGRFSSTIVAKEDRQPTPDTAEIVVRLEPVLLDGERRKTKNFAVFNCAEDACIIFTRNGLYVPRDHPLADARAIEIEIRIAPPKRVRKPKKAAA